MLKVAFVRQRYAHDGGAERFVARALEALRSHNVSLTLVTREWAAPAHPAPAALAHPCAARSGEGFDVITCNPFYLGRLWRDWSFARTVCRELGKISFDLVQSHERIACCDIYRAGDGVHREWLRQLARVRGSFGRLGIALNPYHRYTMRAEKRMFASPRLKAVICNSRMVRDEIRQYFRLSDDKLPVIYSGVDTSAYHPDLKKHRAVMRARYEIPENATLFLFVGSGFERKGMCALLEAMAQLPDNAYLLVAGRDKKSGRYERKASALGIAGRVRFAGSQSDTKPFYGAADAFVLPTLYDPFPNVILEAMACGLPVITSSKSGGAELLDEGVNGFVCDALDVSGLIQRMRRVTPASAMALGAAARSTVESFSLERMSLELRRLYDNLVNHAH